MPETAEGTREPFEVELSPPCAIELEARCDEITRARHVYDGLIWRIARDPRCGALLPLRDPKHPDAELRMAKTRMTPNLPIVCLIYRVQERRVTILRLRVSKPGHDPIL